MTLIKKYLRALSAAFLITVGSISAQAQAEAVTLFATFGPTLLPMWLTVLSVAPCMRPGGDCQNKDRYKLAIEFEAYHYASQFEPGSDIKNQLQYVQLKALADKSGKSFDQIVAATIEGNLSKITKLDRSDLFDGYER